MILVEWQQKKTSTIAINTLAIVFSRLKQQFYEINEPKMVTPSASARYVASEGPIMLQGVSNTDFYLYFVHKFQTTDPPPTPAPASVDTHPKTE